MVISRRSMTIQEKNHLLIRRLTWAACLVPAVFVVIGCGASATVSVRGNIQLTDGSSVSGATVVFEPSDGSVTPSGVTDDDGNFRLTSFRKNDGAPPGEYRIAVHPPMAQDSSESQPSPVFDVRYMSASTSGLTFTVAQQSRQCDLVLAPSRQ